MSRLFILLFLLPLFSIAQTGLTKQSEAAIDSLVYNKMQAWNVYGTSIAIVHNNKVIYNKGFGFRDVQKTKKVTPNTLFEMGSSAKAFTGALLAQMDTDSLLSLRKPISEQYEISFQNKYLTENATFLDLLTHQTGVPGHDFVWLTQKMTRDELLEKAKHFPVLKGLRESFIYNNIFYSLAGYIGARMEDKTWEASLTNRILNPLGMTNTNFSLSETTSNEDFSGGFFFNGTFYSPIPVREIPLIAPAGYVFTNTNDLSLWIKMLLNNGKLDGKQVLQETTLNKMFSPYVVSIFPKRFEEMHYVDYGLGWMISNYRGNLHVSHGGNIDGFTSTVDLLPDADLGIVILTNTATANNFVDNVKYEIIDQILSLSDIDWNERLVSASQKRKAQQTKSNIEQPKAKEEFVVSDDMLEKTAGVYTNEVYGEIAVKKNSDNSLSVTYGPFPLKLLATSKNTFTEQTMFKGQKFMFEKNGGNEIIALKTEFPSSMTSINFKKKK